MDNLCQLFNFAAPEMKLFNPSKTLCQSMILNIPPKTVL
jgi:hypothetical protein